MSTTTTERAQQSRPTPSTPISRRRHALVRRGRSIIRATEAVLGTDDRSEPSQAADDLGAIVAQVDVLVTALIERLAVPVRDEDGADLGHLGSALVAAQAFRSEVHEHEARSRGDRLEALEAGLAPLRWVHDPGELLARVCEAVVRSCGFDRAMLSKVEDSSWRPWKSYAVSVRGPERRFRDWIGTTPEIPLDHLLLESEMIRRHAPAIVTSPDDDPRVYAPLVEASGLRSYVAAPVMPTGRVIGFIHADYASGSVDELDRDALWAFTEAFGQIFERAVLLRRLREQREQVRMAMDAVETVLNDLAGAEIELANRSLDRHATSDGTPRMLPSPSALPGSRISSLLTRRELEVLALMSTGATNKRIAEQLVISDGTVKSHVKRILRKLRAANRSEAISRYLRLTMGQDPAD